MTVIGSNGILPATNLVLIGDMMESGMPVPSPFLLNSAVPPFAVVSAVETTKKMSQDYSNKKLSKTSIGQNENLPAVILVIHGDTIEYGQTGPSSFVLVSAVPPALATIDKKRGDKANKLG